MKVEVEYLIEESEERDGALEHIERMIVKDLLKVKYGREFKFDKTIYDTGYIIRKGAR
ncbi:hypothetical protein [Stenotrophomonas maltophilia group sp. RNC7]|uniref:hypothetical protein n=1 Tax=Stenotrophomonas maltophilia group sp. RNC7 TaxID=3071467 RepID=UPI0027E17F87|nr:hypothetical protein [Stenotrophomonas maltophilia group sp. RNC7]MDQ4678675.1 hypothetical protein [Stenotrophomonas maltophilia group sp. RNC7]